MSQTLSAPWFGVITLFPEMIEPQCTLGVVGRGVSEQKLTVVTFNPRDFTSDKHNTVDDQPYGGGAGMVMMAEPLAAAVQAARQAAPRPAQVVLMSPAGEPLTQTRAREWGIGATLILICGRYEGLDQRFIDEHVDMELSLGDFVLSGGEIAAMAVIDAVARQVDGVLGNQHSKLSESHLDGTLEYPQYTRPERTLGVPVPEILRSGDHNKVARFRRREALKRTFERRPDLLSGRLFTAKDRALLAEVLAEQTSRKESD